MSSALLPTYEHLRQRYSFAKVCKIFNCSSETLMEWIRHGVPLRDGRRVRLECIPLGARRIEFECDEIERVYKLLKSAGVVEADILDFPDEDVREQRRSPATKKRDRAR